VAFESRASHDRQALNHLIHSTSLFLVLGIFEIGSHQSSDLCLASS
jgi:hypothetical protein